MIDINHYWGEDVILGPTGDLGQVSGGNRTTQRVLRRLLTPPRTYIWHPTYGAGVQKYVGVALTSDVEREIKALITGQMFEEVTVARVPQPVIVLSAANNTLSAQITYTDTETNTQQVLAFTAE